MISAYTLVNNGEVTLSNPGETAPTPMQITVPSSGTAPISWKSLQPGVAAVNGQTGEIRAVSKGLAIVIGEFVDKWGINRYVHVLVIVGNDTAVNLDESLRNIIEEAERELAKKPSPYTDETLADLQDAVGNGKAVLNDGDRTTDEVRDAIKDIQDGINGLDKKPVTPDGVIKGDDGNFYKPVGSPDGVYEEVNQDGTSKNSPPTYVYSPDDNPGNGNDKPAIPGNGNYYVEEPENIYKEVNGDGTLQDTPRYGATRRFSRRAMEAIGST